MHLMRRAPLVAALLAASCVGLQAPFAARRAVTGLLPRAPTALLCATQEPSSEDADFARMQAEIDAIMDATAPPASPSAASTSAAAAAPTEPLSNSPLGKRLVAALSSLAATLVFFVQHNSADVSGVALMRRMEAESAPLSTLTCSDRPTLVEFFAPWCESCKEMAPTMRALELKYRDRVNFVAIDGSSAANEQLVSLFRVDGIPHTALLTRDKQVLTALVGAVPRSIMEEDIAALLASRSLPHVGFDAFAGAGDGGGYPLGRKQCDNAEGMGMGQAAGASSAAARGYESGPGAGAGGAGGSFGRSSEDLGAAARAALGPL